MRALIQQFRPVVPQGGGAVDAAMQESLHSGIHAMPLPLIATAAEPWKPCHFFRGRTPYGVSMSCHASALAHGHCPHPPHAHEEEELLLLLAGDVEITLPAMAGTEQQRQRLQPGQFVYYPALFPHTIKTLSEEPANYLMFKWSTDQSNGAASSMAHGRYQVSRPQREHPQVKGYFSELLFEGPTRHLGKLHCHMTRLLPGGGYAEHVDHYDAAIVLLSGECESLGQRVGPNSILFYAGGEPHGMRNVGSTEARYLVFEFHPPVRKPSFWSRLFRSAG